MKLNNIIFIISFTIILINLSDEVGVKCKYNCVIRKHRCWVKISIKEEAFKSIFVMNLEPYQKQKIINMIYFGGSNGYNLVSMNKYINKNLSIQTKNRLALFLGARSSGKYTYFFFTE